MLISLMKMKFEAEKKVDFIFYSSVRMRKKDGIVQIKCFSIVWTLNFEASFDFLLNIS